MQAVPTTAADPALEQLLFVIALTKSAMVLGALAFVAWRQRHPMPRWRQLSYGVSAVAMTAATVMLFTRTALPLVPLLFDGGLIALVLLAFSDAPRFRAARQVAQGRRVDDGVAGAGTAAGAGVGVIGDGVSGTRSARFTVA